MDYKPIILDAFNTLMQADQMRKDDPNKRFKVAAYKKIIAQIKGIAGPITGPAEVASLTGIGAKIREKLDEIFATGSLASAVQAAANSPIAAYDALLKVHGIGSVKAQKLIDAGIKSIAELRAAVAEEPKLLPSASQIGLNHYEEFLERIPRAEMEAHEAFIQDSLPAKFTATIVGSYRRGAATSGDIDVLLTVDEATPAKQILRFREYVLALGAAGYITDTLALGEHKCMAVCRIAGEKHRRLDLLLTPHDEIAYATLYFTGSDTFNVAMRSWALERGWSLNEHTLNRVEPMHKTSEGSREHTLSRIGTTEPKPELPAMESEADIFRFLGLQYIDPTERTGPEKIIAAPVGITIRRAKPAQKQKTE